MDFNDSSTINKLLLLFVFDKMDMPITENTIIEMCTSRNVWFSYMDCKLTLSQLLDAGFVFQTSHAKNIYYSITPDGRMCLSHFYQRIPSSQRLEISDYIKANRMTFRRKQEYFTDYFKNDDGTYTVLLKIMDPVQTTIEIKLNIANRALAKQVCKKWEEKASNVYYSIHELLID